MSDALFRYWPAIMAGIVGAAIPRRDGVKLRLGLGLIAAILVFSIQALWPEAAPQADALRSQIHALRRALLEHGFDGVETVHGVGLRLVAREPDGR